METGPDPAAGFGFDGIGCERNCGYIDYIILIHGFK
jgi:hypothetical protein